MIGEVRIWLRLARQGTGVGGAPDLSACAGTLGKTRSPSSPLTRGGPQLFAQRFGVTL